MPLVIGHRGASADFPENTLDAFHGASAQGADWVELDVRRTADAVLVVHHDPAVATGAVIAETAFEALPSSVPTLGAALGACGTMGVNVEIKNDPGEPGFDPTDRLAAQTLEVIASIEDLVVLVSSFHLPTIDTVKRLDPTVPTGYLVLDPGDAVSVALDRGHEAINPWNLTTTEALVASARASGLAVNVWTVDDPVRIQELAAWGVDGIITNRPGLACQVLGRD